MKNLLNYCILISLLTSCISEKKRAKICSSCPVITEVVTKEKITSFDTALYISKMGKDLSFKTNDSDCCVLVNSLMKQLSAGNGTITVKKDGIKSSVFKTKGVVIFRCEADSLKEVIKGLRTEISESKTETKIIQEDCKKDHKDWLDKYDRPIMWLALVYLISLLGIKFGPRLIKLFL